METVILILCTLQLLFIVWVAIRGRKVNISDPLAPVPGEAEPEYLDELLELRDGRWKRCVPPIWVPEGESPVAYAALKGRENGKLYHSRRVNQ